MKKVCVEKVGHEVNNPLTIIALTIEENKKNLSEKDYKILVDSIRRIANFTLGLRNETERTNKK